MSHVEQLALFTPWPSTNSASCSTWDISRTHTSECTAWISRFPQLTALCSARWAPPRLRGRPSEPAWFGLAHVRVIGFVAAGCLLGAVGGGPAALAVR